MSSENSSVDSSKVEHEVPSQTPSHIRLRIQSQDGVIEHFIMRRSIKLKNLLLTYCKTVGIKYEETRFFVDGYFFNHERTPNELGMQDYELIAAMGEQLGGGGGGGAGAA